MSNFLKKAGKVYREMNHCLARAEVYLDVTSKK